MKRLFLCCLIAVIGVIMSACANSPVLELAEVSAEIVTDKSISGQTGIGVNNAVVRHVTPTVIAYDIKVKNSSNRKIGDEKNPVRFKIQPGEELLEALNKTVGDNVLDRDKMNGGYQGDAEILPGGTSRYMIFSELGTLEKLENHEQLRLLTEAQLDELREKRFDAALILYIGEEEIGRFDLRPHSHGLPLEIHRTLEQELGAKFVVPAWKGYQVKFAAIEYPPVAQGKAVGNRHAAVIVYSDRKGPLMNLSPEQVEQIEKKQGRKFLYGEYEGKPLIAMEISNEKGSLINAKTREIEGVQVEYNEKETGSGKVMFYAFPYQQASYFITFHMSDTFSEEDTVSFVRQILAGQK